MIDEIKKIDLPLQKLLEQEPTEVIEHFIELSADKIRWVGEFYADEVQKDEDDEETLPKENVFNFFDITVLKERVSLIQVIYTDNANKFRVVIQAMGTDEDMVFYFKTKDKALKLKEQLVTWWTA